MNPHTYLLGQITPSQRENMAVAALAALLPYWASAWTSSPTAYQNVVQPVLDQVNVLPRSPLQREMAAFLNGRLNTGVGISFAP